MPPENPKALADAIRATLDDRAGALARARAAQHRQRAEYDVGPWSARYEALYRALIAARARTGGAP